MIWFFLYMGIGVVAFFVSLRVDRKSRTDPDRDPHQDDDYWLLPLFLLLDPLAACAWLFWPIGLPLLMIHNAQEARKAPDESAKAPKPAPIPSNIGTRGITNSLLLPSGTVDLEGKTYAAQSEFGTIEPGTRVEVVAESMGILTVRDITPLDANR